MILRVDKLVRDIFGRWNNDHNARKSAKMAMIHEINHEELQAHGIRLREYIRQDTVAKLENYAKQDEMKKLKEEVEEIRNRLNDQQAVLSAEPMTDRPPSRQRKYHDREDRNSQRGDRRKHEINR